MPSWSKGGRVCRVGLRGGGLPSWPEGGCQVGLRGVLPSWLQGPQVPIPPSNPASIIPILTHFFRFRGLLFQLISAFSGLNSLIIPLFEHPIFQNSLLPGHQSSILMEISEGSKTPICSQIHLLGPHFGTQKNTFFSSRRP